MKTIPVDRTRLVEALESCENRVTYNLGAKVPLDAEPGAIKKIDCSGWARWLVHFITHGETTMPDGSQNQLAWCRESNFKLTEFGNCALTDGRLRICFMRAKPGGHGHVWLCINGRTIESYGGHGVGRRKWDTLKRSVCATYVLTEPLS